MFLAVDGGGTGCRAAVANTQGKILGNGQAGPANIASNPEGALVNILHAARMALEQAVGVDAAANHWPELVAGMGLAGVNSAGAADALVAALPFARTRVVSDALTSAKGALGEADGIVAAIGTGSVFAVQSSGKLSQFGGWGLVLGDESGGAWIGRAILARALRANDGFVPNSPMLIDLTARYGGPFGVVRFAAKASPAEFAALTPEVLSSNDAGAEAVLTEAANILRTSLTHLRQRWPLPVCFIGGLGPAFADRLGDIPQRAALGNGLDGALRLAIEERL